MDWSIIKKLNIFGLYGFEMTKVVDQSFVGISSIDENMEYAMIKVISYRFSFPTVL